MLYIILLGLLHSMSSNEGMYIPGMEGIKPNRLRMGVMNQDNS